MSRGPARARRSVGLFAVLLALAACSSQPPATQSPLAGPTASRPAPAPGVTPVPLPTNETTPADGAEARRALAARLAELRRDLAALDSLLENTAASGSLDRVAAKQIVHRLEDSATQFDALPYPGRLRLLQTPYHNLAQALHRADKQALDMLDGPAAVQLTDIAALYKTVQEQAAAVDAAMALQAPSGADTVTPIAQPSVQATAAP